jgi:hypothetical protein
VLLEEFMMLVQAVIEPTGDDEKAKAQTKSYFILKKKLRVGGWNSVVN